MRKEARMGVWGSREKGGIAGAGRTRKKRTLREELQREASARGNEARVERRVEGGAGCWKEGLGLWGFGNLQHPRDLHMDPRTGQ